MRHIKEFSRFAKNYGHYNIIQKNVAQELIASIADKPEKIIDLGCGSGTLFDKVTWNITKYVAVDLSEKMLELHPLDESIHFIHANFDDQTLFKRLAAEKCQRLISSSSFQWSEDLGKLFENINKLTIPFSFSLFTSNTFKTIHKTAGITSPLRSSKEISALVDKYLNANYHIETYTLAFKSKKELFSYIKKSGVSGSHHQLSYKETKKLILEYPLDYLEFEVMFIDSIDK